MESETRSARHCDLAEMSHEDAVIEHLDWSYEEGDNDPPEAEWRQIRALHRTNSRMPFRQSINRKQRPDAELLRHTTLERFYDQEEDEPNESIRLEDEGAADSGEDEQKTYFLIWDMHSLVWPDLKPGEWALDSDHPTVERDPATFRVEKTHAAAQLHLLFGDILVQSRDGLIRIARNHSVGIVAQPG